LAEFAPLPIAARPLVSLDGRRRRRGLGAARRPTHLARERERSRRIPQAGPPAARRAIGAALRGRSAPALGRNAAGIRVRNRRGNGRSRRLQPGKPLMSVLGLSALILRYPRCRRRCRFPGNSLAARPKNVPAPAGDLGGPRPGGTAGGGRWRPGACRGRVAPRDDIGEARRDRGFLGAMGSTGGRLVPGSSGDITRPA